MKRTIPADTRPARYAHTLLLAALSILTGTTRAWADWPQWRHDANRSGATIDRCSDQMTLQWQRDLGQPDPAYDHQYRMCADASYAAVAGRGKVFVPSNRADTVTAYDVDSGKVVWRYVAEGPVRMAPLLEGDAVIFGSDDGYLVCVDAERGTLRWRLRGVPDDVPNSRMLINGRLASRWPVRGAPVASGGVVFFGSGLWPEEGVYVTAADCRTGEVLWRSDCLSYVREGMSDHGRAYDLGLPPQGYPAVIDGKLAMPSGRSLAAWFDPASGEMEPYSCFYVKLNPPRGTWYVSGIGKYSVQGGNWFATRPGTLPPVPSALAKALSGIYGSRNEPENELAAAANRPFLQAVKYALHNENLYPEPVLTETTAYASEFDAPAKYLVPRGHTRVSYPAMDRIVARDLMQPQWVEVPEKLHLYPNSAKIRRVEFPVRWAMKTPLRLLIKAGDRLIAGESGRIASIAIPEPGQQPALAWQSRVEGNPVHALVASERLFVVTDTGKLYCFGSGTAEQGEPDFPVPMPLDTPKEYALCLGSGIVNRAQALAEAGRYRVVLLEADRDQAVRLRDQFAAAGLEANRLQIIYHEADLRLTPYWANRVLLGTLSSDRGAARSAVRMALEAMRPETGCLEVIGGPDEQRLVQRLVETRPDYTIDEWADRLVVLRTQPRPGSDEWTHEAGGPGNTFSNSEELVRWPLATLWYSGAIDRYFTPDSHFQHERNPYPLVAGGRMFLITHEELHAIDIYTGCYLWKAVMPKTAWVETRYEDSRVYGRPVDRNYVATDDAVYAILEEEIHVYSAENGTKTAVITIPEGMKKVGFQPRWTEVRIEGDLLLAILGDTLVALNRRSGELVWKRKSTLDATTFALGNGRVMGLDFVPTEIGGRGRPETLRGPLFVLDVETGHRVWSHEVEYDSVPEHTVDQVRPWLLPPNPEVAYNGKHDLIVLTARRNSVSVYRADDGQLAWKKAGRSGNFQRIYSPVVTDDYLVLSDYAGFFAYVLDITTGKDRTDAGIPRPRTCARIIGNNHLLVYRDAATELYDLATCRMIGLNSVRSGCTTSFIPAGGILTAPMLGHGCVCNYPMFASEALYHTEDFEAWRPKAVVASWVNQAAPVEDGSGAVASGSAGFPKELADLKVDVKRFTLTNATLQQTGAGLLFGTKDEKEGYAVAATEEPLAKATFRLALKRASGVGRHGNAFFLFGSSGDPGHMIQCRLYYGGRSSLMITGDVVERVEKKSDLRGRRQFEVTVEVDCREGTVTFKSADDTVTAKLRGDWQAVTHYGYGGGNSDNLFTGVLVE